MKIDVYTKVILTGIFLCLCLLLLRDVRFVDKAHAELNGSIPHTITINHNLNWTGTIGGF